jgi:acyl-CoA synthetase (AMP-forming)/AMP-acid ligase II
MERGLLGASYIGREIPGVEARIGAAPAQQPGSAGELFIRSEQVASRYRDEDGWYGTGDLVTRNQEGYLQILGRADRMINSGAYHLYPQEIEQAIRKAFDVVSVTVYGEPDEKWGEAVVARIAWGAGVQAPSLADFRQVLSKHIARYKVPRRLYQV